MDAAKVCVRQVAMPRYPAASRSFRAGDRVRCKRGPAVGELGFIVERQLPNRRRSISPRPDFVFVLFDRAQGVVIEVDADVLEKVAE
jgi:hypothetical protein